MSSYLPLIPPFLPVSFNLLQDKVTVLAEIAEWPEEIDVNRAKEAKTRAERRLSSNDPHIDVVRAEAALKRSLARLGAAR